jgi:hypothetical protein
MSAPKAKVRKEIVPPAPADNTNNDDALAGLDDLVSLDGEQPKKKKKLAPPPLRSFQMMVQTQSKPTLVSPYTTYSRRFRGAVKKNQINRVRKLTFKPGAIRLAQIYTENWFINNIVVPAAKILENSKMRQCDAATLQTALANTLLVLRKQPVHLKWVQEFADKRARQSQSKSKNAKNKPNKDAMDTSA